MGDGVVHSCAFQNVIDKPAKAHVDNERGIAEVAVDLQVSQIYDCPSYNRIPGSVVFAVHFHGNDRYFWCYSVESRRERRGRQIVAKSENDARHRDSVTESVPFPFLRLARNRPSVSAPAPKTSSKLHGNPLLREISPPVKRQSAVDHSHVDAIAVITNDARRSRAELGHVHRVQVPIVYASGEVAFRVTLRIWICSCYVGERLNCGKLGTPGAQCDCIDLRNDVQHLPVRTEIPKNVVTRRLI